MRLISLGEEVFRDRLREVFRFETQAVGKRLGGVMKIIKALNGGDWLSSCLVAMKGFYPIYLTLEKQ